MIVEIDSKALKDLSKIHKQEVQKILQAMQNLNTTKK
jgi:mRNA-degrading endonuclease RelE of RelBE toxin-antitoxin system